MAVDLPVPPTPLPFGEAQIRAYGAAADVQTFPFLSHRVHIAGAPQLAIAQVEPALDGASNLSDAVRALGMAYYRAGYPAAQLYYALVDRDLHILVLPGRIEALSGPAQLQPYFRALLDDAVLTAERLEPRRALAALHAQRSGHDVRMAFVPGSADGSQRLELQSRRAAAPRPGLRLEIGNPGSRFVGREFAEAEATLTGGGSELRALRRENLGSEGRYREHGVSAGVVGSAGVFTIDGRRVDYEQDSADLHLDARISNAGLSWSFLPHADFNTRWLVNLRLDATHDAVAASSGSIFLTQRYTALQVGVVRTQAMEAGAWPLQLQWGLAAHAGIDGRMEASNPDDVADLHFLALRPSLSLRSGLPGREHWELSLDIQGQASGDAVPRQQQFVLGGSSALAAWLPGVIAGDSGYLLRLQATGRLGGSTLSLSPRAFVEVGGGAVQVDHAGAAVADALADGGIELTARSGQWLEASVVAARPLWHAGIERSRTEPQRADVFFRLTLRY